VVDERIRKKEGLPINLHLAETEKENEDFIAEHGMRPIPFLENTDSSARS